MENKWSETSHSCSKNMNNIWSSSPNFKPPLWKLNVLCGNQDMRGTLEYHKKAIRPTKFFGTGLVALTHQNNVGITFQYLVMYSHMLLNPHHFSNQIFVLYSCFILESAHLVEITQMSAKYSWAFFKLSSMKRCDGWHSTRSLLLKNDTGYKMLWNVVYLIDEINAYGETAAAIPYLCSKMCSYCTILIEIEPTFNFPSSSISSWPKETWYLSHLRIKLYTFQTYM